MKKFLFSLYILITFMSVYAQPNWTPVNYTNSTTAYGIVTINSTPAVSGDKVGAFVGSECRAVGNVTINSGTAYVSLVIQGEQVETASFKVWQASTNTIFNVAFTTQTNPGSVIGSPPDYLAIAAASASNTLVVTPDYRDVTSSAGTTTFSVSNSGSGTMNWTAFSNNTSWLTITSGSSGINTDNITVGYTANNTGVARTGTITVTASGASGSPKTVEVRQDGTTPTITVSTSSLEFGNVVVGQNSSPQSYTVSGTNLTENITIQSPTGFQLSLNSTSGFASSLNLTQSGGTVTTTTIYAMFSPQITGIQTGNISHTSIGATSKNVSLSGTGKQTCTPVTVATQPTNQTATVGSRTTFSVSVNGTGPFFYSWYKNGELVSSSSTATSSTTNAYTTPILTAAGNGDYYRCVITNCGNAYQAWSNTVYLTINGTCTSVSITSQPTNQTATIGNSATFSVSVNGTGPFFYSWYKKGELVSSSPTATSSTTNAYTTPILTSVESGNYYYCLITNCGGAYQAQSNNAYLTVITDVTDIESSLPKFYNISQNYPNPFNPTTTIRYNISKVSKVILKIYDVLGREVETLVDEEKSPDQYEVQFKAKGLASGVYFYQIRAGDFILTKKLVLLK